MLSCETRSQFMLYGKIVLGLDWWTKSCGIYLIPYHPFLQTCWKPSQSWPNVGTHSGAMLNLRGFDRIQLLYRIVWVSSRAGSDGFPLLVASSQFQQKDYKSLTTGPWPGVAAPGQSRTARWSGADGVVKSWAGGSLPDAGWMKGFRDAGTAVNSGLGWADVFESVQRANGERCGVTWAVRRRHPVWFCRKVVEMNAAIDDTKVGNSGDHQRRSLLKSDGSSKREMADPAELDSLLEGRNMLDWLAIIADLLFIIVIVK